jgi:hypothetical protein
MRAGRIFATVCRTADPAPWVKVNRIGGQLVGVVLRVGARRLLSVGVLRGRHHGRRSRHA